MFHLQIIRHVCSNLSLSSNQMFRNVQMFQITCSDIWCVSKHLVKVRKYMPSMAYFDKLLALTSHMRQFHVVTFLYQSPSPIVIKLHKNNKKLSQTKAIILHLVINSDFQMKNIVIYKLSKHVISVASWPSCLHSLLTWFWLVAFDWLHVKEF